MTSLGTLQEHKIKIPRNPLVRPAKGKLRHTLLLIFCPLGGRYSIPSDRRIDTFVPQVDAAQKIIRFFAGLRAEKATSTILSSLAPRNILPAAHWILLEARVFLILPSVKDNNQDLPLTVFFKQ